MRTQKPKSARTSSEMGQMRYLFASELQAKIMPVHTATVKVNKKGETENIEFTHASSDAKAPECGWPDKKLVWKGSASDLEIHRGEKKFRHGVEVMNRIPPVRNLPPLPARTLSTLHA